MATSTPTRLSRRLTGRTAAPVAIAHLGLGAFFRAHQAVYTDLAPDAEAWGIAAFTGRRPALAERLSAQDGLYTLLVRGPDGESCSVISSVSQARPGSDAAGWLDVLAAPTTALVTITVTEAAYLRAADGRLSFDDPAVRTDIGALRRGDPAGAGTVPGRLLAGLAARHDAGGDPLAVLPCDNLLHNGAAVRRVVLDLADEVDAGLADWVRKTVSFVDSEVDRITPRTTGRDIEAVRRATGLVDECPVVTEPFSEWVIGGTRPSDFPGGRPDWGRAGALFVDDVTPYEHRKLWLLNGAHSLLAYAGSIRGHETVAQAITDPTCLAWVEGWWDEAGQHLELTDQDVRTYRTDLLRRFENPGIRHRLEQIAADGSQKLPVRVLPVLRAERAAGRGPGAAARTLGAWVAHLRGAGATVTDPLADRLVALARGALPDAVRRVLELLDPDLSGDPTLVAAVVAHAEELEHR
jgi:fructuronate reductase